MKIICEHLTENRFTASVCVRVCIFVLVFAFVTFMWILTAFRLPTGFPLIFRTKAHTHSRTQPIFLNILQIIYHWNHNSILIRCDFPLSFIFHYRLLFAGKGKEECVHTRTSSKLKRERGKNSILLPLLVHHLNLFRFFSVYFFNVNGNGFFHQLNRNNYTIILNVYAGAHSRSFAYNLQSKGKINERKSVLCV